MGFYISQKAKFLIPIILVSGFCRPTGLADRARIRSTDVHKRARFVWLEGRSTDPVDRPESSALWKTPVDRAVDRQRVLLSVFRPRSTGPFDRWLNGQISDHWASVRPAQSTVAWKQRAELTAGRPALQPNKACTLVQRGRPFRSTSRSQKQGLYGLKTWLFDLNKIP